MFKGARHRRVPGFAFGALLLVTTLSAAAEAKPDSQASGKGGSLTMRRSTIDAGGGRSSGGDFSLTATLGQTDTTAMDGGAFTLHSGFWIPRAMATPELIFADGFE